VSGGSGRLELFPELPILFQERHVTIQSKIFHRHGQFTKPRISEHKKTLVPPPKKNVFEMTENSLSYFEGDIHITNVTVRL